MLLQPLLLVKNLDLVFEGEVGLGLRLGGVIQFRNSVLTLQGQGFFCLTLGL